MSPKPAERLSLSLITPNYNGDAFLRETFESVASQSLSGLEYIFVDGASTDQSMAIAQGYSNLVTRTISEPDRGHAHALNKGFAASSGEIMGWINSDDVLLPRCLETVRKVFESFPEVEWITGRASTINAQGELCDVSPIRPWSRLRFLSGDHLWIQQESTFWRRGLWERAGGYIDSEFEVANDFELWARFFRHAPLYSVDRMLGCFRIRDGQRSVIQRKRYIDETEQILKRELNQIAEDYRAQYPSLLPEQPKTLTPLELREMDTALSAEDMQEISSTAIRSGKLANRIVRDSRFDWDDRAVDTERRVSKIGRIFQRNWTFLTLTAGGASLALGVSSLAPFANDALRTLVLFGLAMAFTAAVAVKTRRIILSMERDLRRALGYRARAELRLQRLEAEIDELVSGPTTIDRDES